MKVTVEKIDDINFIMSGTVDNSVIKNKVDNLKKDASAEDNVEQQAAGEVFKEFIDAGIKEANIDIETILGQPGLKKYEQQEDSVYVEVDLSISPEINTDITYEDIVPSFTKPQADTQALEKKLSDFVLQQTPFMDIDKPRAVIDGDVAVIDFSGFINDVPFEGGSAEKFNLKIGSKSFIPGFEDKLIGMEYNEERTIMVTFPVEYEAKDLAGKETKFIVKLHKIQTQEPQDPDDAFAQKILNDPKATLDTLKAKLSDQIISEEISKIYMTDLKPKIIQGLLSKFNFTLPNNIVEQELDAKVREEINHLSEDEQKTYMDDKEKFQTFRNSLRENARTTIKSALIIEALAKKEGIEVHEQEIQAALGYQAMMTGQDAQELLKYYQENNLMTSAKMGLTEDKLFGQMLGLHQS